MGDDMANEFRWAFIGTGTLAKKVIREITASKRHIVVSAYSRNREKLETFCKPYGTYAATSIKDAVSRPDVDAVYISVTNESHFAVCKECLELGKPVLLEKPFTIKAEQTKALQNLAKEKGLYLSEAMWTWFSDVPNKVKDIVQKGKLGKIKDVYMAYSMDSIGYAPRVSDPKLGGGAVLDIGIYPITYAYRLFGYPVSIECKGDLRDGIDYGESLVFTYDGFKVHMDISIVGDKGLGMCIDGQKGIIMSPGFHKGEPAMVKIGDEVSILEGDKGYLKEFDSVAEEIRNDLRESSYIPFKSTYDCMTILDECRRQMKLVYPFE